MKFSLMDFEVKEILSNLPVQVIDWGVQMVNAPAVWSKTKGENVKIAILDTGIDLEHVDLSGNIVKYMNFTSEEKENVIDNIGHGTHVAGIVSGIDNDEGIIGVAPQSDLYIAKVLDSSSDGSLDSIISAIEWSILNKVDIISISLGAKKDPGSIFKEAILNAYNKGIIIVAASGNNSGELNWPAAYTETISVGAINNKKEHAYFSNYGTQLDIVAPGVDILSTFPSSKYAKMSGTSMAAPIVSGIIALILSYYKKNHLNYDKQTIINLINDFSEDIGDVGKDIYTGNGLINIKNTI